jgi:ATP-dependent Lon protease
VDRSVQNRVKKQMERAQKEYYLNEKIKAIQKELGRKDEKSELDELRRKVEGAGMPKDAKEKALQELRRIEMMPPMSAESSVSRNYLDWLIAVPWKKKSREIRDIDLAEKTLNEDHYGLEKIKDRILEFLSVRQLVKKPCPSLVPQDASLYDSHLAGFVTRPRCEVIAAPISARCPVRSSR